MFASLDPNPSPLLRLVHDGDFSCEYQPLVRPADGSIGGFEALARFWLDDQEVVPSSVFSDADADPALFLVLESELKSLQLRHRPDGRPLFLNLHPSVCARSHLVEHWIALLGQAEDVVVELVESSRVTDLAQLHRFVRRLRESGIPCALDDVGSPESLFSFELLEACSYLKLDRRWLSRIQTDAAYLAMLEGMLTFARSKGIGTVLEGVEDAGHLAWARRLGIDLVQGYRFQDQFRRPPAPAPTRVSGPISSLGALPT
jgi:EAL domain-containing protein (putative c-di-GMP-specific phosphodiesterase class I)